MSEEAFCLHSRGDRVYGRFEPGPGRACRPIVLAAPDGDCAGPWAAAAFATWNELGAVASLDLPLCGRRSSEKLGDAAFSDHDPLGVALRGQLREQLQSDLDELRSWLGSRGFADSAALVASGRGLVLTRDLALPFEPRIEQPQGDDPGDWAAAVAARLRERLA